MMASTRTPLVDREQQHRRRVLLAVAGLILLSLSPVFGHHLISSVPWLSASQEHLGPFCLVALHHLLAPVHTGAHVLLGLGVAAAFVERGRAVIRQRAVLDAMRSAEPAKAEIVRAVHAAGDAVGLAPTQIRVVQGMPNPAFTAGWWRPVVYVDADMPRQLSREELEAVLAHEQSHVRHRDPLRLFALRALAVTLFWIPALRRLTEDMTDEVEILADDEAAVGRELPLASAILRMAGGDPGTAEPAVGFQRADLLDRRIRRLAGEPARIATHLSRRAIVWAVAALFVVWTSGIMVLHPLPGTPQSGNAPIHCVHPHQLAIMHLFCRGLDLGSMPAECPHRTKAKGPVT